MNETISFLATTLSMAQVQLADPRDEQLKLA